MRHNKAPTHLLPLLHIIRGCASPLILLHGVSLLLNPLHLASSSSSQVKLGNISPPCSQIFMCLLWMLLQFVVLAMYWDGPPISSEGGAVVMEMKREHGDEEEVPLMGSDEETVHTYRAVSANQLETSSSSEMQPIRCSSEMSNPFRTFSASRGERATLTVCPEQWFSAFLCHVDWLQVGRGATANAHVLYWLYWFSSMLTHRQSFPFPVSLRGILHSMSHHILYVSIRFVCMCLVLGQRVCMMSGILLD